MSNWIFKTAFTDHVIEISLKVYITSHVWDTLPEWTIFHGIVSSLLEYTQLFGMFIFAISVIANDKFEEFITIDKYSVFGY